MKSPEKRKDARAAGRITRAGHGGRKQAQTGYAPEERRVDEADAGMVDPPHPARPVRGTVVAGDSRRPRGGPARARVPASGPATAD